MAIRFLHFPDSVRIGCIRIAVFHVFRGNVDLHSSESGSLADCFGGDESANSPLVSQISFTHSGTTNMVTSKQFDYINRITEIE